MDTIVVLGSIPETFVQGQGSAFTTFRTLRLARLLQLARRWESLRRIVTGLMGSAKHIVLLCAIFSLFLFILALIGMSLFAEVLEGQRVNYSNVGNALLSVFILVTGVCITVNYKRWEGLN